MKHLSLLNRSASLLIVIAIVSLFGAALYTLQSAERADAAMDMQHERLDAYRGIVPWLRREDDAIDLSSLTSTDQTNAFSIAARQLNLHLDAVLKPRPADASDETALLTVRRMHDVHVITAVELMAALQHHRADEAKTIASGRYLPQSRALNTFLLQREAAVEETYHHLDHERDLSYPRVHVALLVVVGVTLIITMVLLITIAAYRRRADQVLHQEVIRLEEASLTDGLTDLGNHRAFHNALADQVARSQRYLRPFTLAVIDIDHFKALNDTKGHGYGDDVLSRLGEILKRLRSGDTAYRLGGDEFAILLAEADTEQAQIALQRLQQFVRRTFVGVTLSIGFAEWKDKVNGHDLRECADSALYEAKRKGRNAIVDFEEIRNTVSVISSGKSRAFQRLISEDDALSVAFQPIWAIEGSIIGFEALARPAPELGFNGPQEAFDIAEHLHRVIDLDLRCMHKTVQMAKALPAGVSLFINIVPETLVHPSFDPEAWIAQVRAAGIAPSQIVVEITERSIIYPAILVSRAMILKSLGVRIALDDTGAGYAGLEVLSSITFDFVKIDRGLMLKAQSERGARGVLAGIISIAQETGALLIAEGIESFEQLDFITHVHERETSSIGVSALQGFLLGEPRTGALDPSLFARYAQRLHEPHMLAGLTA